MVSGKQGHGNDGQVDFELRHSDSIGGFMQFSVKDVDDQTDRGYADRLMIDGSSEDNSSLNIDLRESTGSYTMKIPKLNFPVQESWLNSGSGSREDSEDVNENALTNNFSPEVPNANGSPLILDIKRLHMQDQQYFKSTNVSPQAAKGIHQP